MSADTIQSQYENLEQVAQRFARRAETIQQLHSNVTRQTQKLAGTWEGKAATAFMQEMRATIFPGLLRLSNALEQGSRTTTKIAQVMKQAEEEAARLFQGKSDGGMSTDGWGGGGLENGGLGFGSNAKSDGSSPIIAFAQTGEGDGDGYTIEDINQSDLSVFFSQYEDDIPDDILEQYLTNPEIMAIQQQVMNDLIERVQNGEPPLTPQEFYDMVLAETGDPATAFIVCHNITKAMGRGSDAIGWQRSEDEPFVYSLNGQPITFDPSTFHPDALAEANGHPSVFYAVFDSETFGTNDPGDWYHFYINATASYLGATGQLDFSNDGGGGTYEGIVDDAIDSTMDQMREGYSADTQNSNGVNGWIYANTLSYLEGGVYGEDYSENHAEAQAETLRESELHRDGALFGLQVAGVTPTEEMVWHVPIAGGIDTPGALDVLFGGGADVDMGDDTHATIAPDGTTTVVEDEGDGDEGGGRR